MPNHWLEFQPMCFKIFFITKQNKVKESNKTPSNFIWLFLRGKENWNDSPNSLATAQCYLTHLLVELPSLVRRVCVAHTVLSGATYLFNCFEVTALRPGENMHIVNRRPICRARRSDSLIADHAVLSPLHPEVAQGRKSIVKWKESTTNTFL